MIPGKVFFESINVSQQFSKRYQIHLLLNGIYYDKIQLFQSKYLCLTANDLLQVQLTLKNPQYHNFYEENHHRDIRNMQQPQVKKKQSYVKVLVPQAYKLLIQSKTIEVKFILNKKNRHQSIKVNLAFEPVATFNRKKLGANLGGIKNHGKSPNTHLAYFNNSSDQNPNVFQFNQGDSVTSNEELFAQELNFMKKDQFSQLQSPISNHSKANTMKQQNFFINKNHGQKPPKERGFSKQKHQRNQGFNPQQQFSQTIKSETFSDLFDKQINSSRTYNPGVRENIKISEDSNEESYQANQNDDQTDGNYNSSEAPSDLDTLESLAYQREKILGQLFGKFSHRHKK